MTSDITAQPSLLLDHIVIGVPNLADAIAEFYSRYQVAAVMGGKHRGFGTHNALLGLGAPADAVYLELLAIDPDDKTPYAAYPLGLTPHMTDPRVMAWCLRCEHVDIEVVNRAMQALGSGYNHGEVQARQRQTPAGETIAWRMASAAQTIARSAGTVPFLIQWNDAKQQPARQVAVENFLSYEFTIAGPDSLTLREDLETLGFMAPNAMRFVESPAWEMVLNLSAVPVSEKPIARHPRVGEDPVRGAANHGQS